MLRKHGAQTQALPLFSGPQLLTCWHAGGFSEDASRRTVTADVSVGAGVGQERRGAVPPSILWASCPVVMILAGLSFLRYFGNTLSLNVIDRTFQSLPLL